MPSNRQPVPEVRRLEGQALAAFGQHGLEFGQRGAGTHRDHQFAGFVAADALERGRVQKLALQRPMFTGGIVTRTIVFPRARNWSTK